MTEQIYTATTGKTYKMTQDQDGLWTVGILDDQGKMWIRCGGIYNHRVATPEAGIERIEAEERVRVATEGLPRTFDRQGYEDACVRAGIAVLTDKEVWRKGYGLKYADLYIQIHGADALIEQAIGVRRLWAIEEEAAAKAEEARKAAPQVEDDHIAPAGTTTTRRSYGTGQCAVCKRVDSYWNSGAGSFLCETHWDEY